MKHIDRQILQIALPSIVSNITVPLLGLIDVAIVGHLGSPAYIGAIAVGGMLFNIIYWIFGFLRMGTSGMTSQAYGKRDLPEIVRLLMRSVGIGLAVALCLILLQVPIRQTAFLIIHPTAEVREMATLYFHICIWGAPAMLGLYGLSGWFIGMQNSRIPMYIAITQNIVNIIASLSFVCFFKMKVEGVAFGTLIAQYAGFIMGLVLWMSRYGKLKKYILWKGTAKGGDDALFPSEPRHILTDIVPGHRYAVLHLGRRFTRRNYPCGKHIADAALHPVLLCHGRLCLCGRGTERTIYRCP